MTGRSVDSVPPLDEAVANDRSKRMGSWKSTWMVAHWRAEERRVRLQRARRACESRAHLMLALQGIKQKDVNFRAVEGAVAGVELPRAAGGVERARELCLCLVPRGDLSEIVLGPGGQKQLVFETKYAITANGK